MKILPSSTEEIAGLSLANTKTWITTDLRFQLSGSDGCTTRFEFHFKETKIRVLDNN